MSQSAKPIHVGRDVALQTPVGELVDCVTVWLWNTTPLSARLLLTVHQWNHVRTAGLFDVGGLDLPVDFSPVDSLLVDLEAVDPSLPIDTPTLKKRFADPDSPLRSTESWTATGVRDHESAVGSGADTIAADSPRVRDIGISMQQSSPGSDSATVPPTAAETVDTDGLTETLARVATDLAAENRPFEPAEDGTSLSLTATIDHATWTVIIEDTTGGDGFTDSTVDGPCLIRSIYPNFLGESRRGALQPELEAYGETLNRGGFVVEESTGRVEVRTPFDPAGESTTDALTENVTALAEWYDRLAG